MIGLAFYDSKAPINLFRQDHAHETVRKCQAGKTDALLRPFQHSRRQSAGTANHEYQMRVSLIHTVTHPTRQFHRIPCPAVYT